MEFRIEIDTRLEEAHQQLERWRDELADADSETRESLRPRIERLRELRQTIAQRLTQLDASEEADFKEKKLEVQRQLAELEGGVKGLGQT